MKLSDLQLWRSSRLIAREMGLSQPRVLEVLHDNELHANHYSRSARLFSGDRPLRIQFCKSLRRQNTADELILYNILWTERKDIFKREGVFDIHNSHLWARDDRPCIRECAYQFRSSVSATILGDIVVGPCLLPAWQADCSVISWFSGNCSTGTAWGAGVVVSARWSLVTLWRRCPQWLNSTYPGRWNGCRGLIPWPSPSPDLTSMDFFMLG
jgi:hypothetical protein